MTPGDPAALALRLASALHFDLGDSADWSPPVARAAENAADLLARAARDARDAPSDPPEAALDALAATLSGLKVPSGAGSGLLRTGLAALAQALRSPWCAPCATLQPGCLTPGADCIAGLGGRLHALAAWAADGLARAAPTLPAPAIRFRLRLLARSDPAAARGILADHAIKAETNAETDGPIDIRIDLVEHRIDRATLDQLPYVVLHELVCHAFQGLALPPAQRLNAPPSCLWTEAWMDTLAHRLAIDWWRTRGAAFPAASASYHDWGYAAESHKRAQRNAANTLAEALRLAADTGRETPADFLRFSIRLNARRGQGATQADLARRLRVALRQDQPWQAGAVRACRHYLAHDDPGRLIAALDEVLPSDLPNSK
jgi:hypothetical protein